MFIDTLDHWVIEAGLAVIGDLLVAYATVALVCLYRVYWREMATVTPTVN